MEACETPFTPFGQPSLGIRDTNILFVQFTVGIATRRRSAMPHCNTGFPSTPHSRIEPVASFRHCRRLRLWFVRIELLLRISLSCAGPLHTGSSRNLKLGKNLVDPYAAGSFWSVISDSTGTRMNRLRPGMLRPSSGRRPPFWISVSIQASLRPFLDLHGRVLIFG